MLSLLFQTATPHRRTILTIFRHLGAFGLFSLAVLDGSPLPTFGGPDVLLVILVASRRHPWYEYVVAAAVGSVIGACLTFTIAQRSGKAYLGKRFGQSRVGRLLDVFEKHGGALLASSTAIPFPFPTSAIFAAAGASGYPLPRFLFTVSVCRALRYTFIAMLADRYGRAFVRVLRHPLDNWHWLIFFTGLAAFLVWVVFTLNRRIDQQMRTHSTDTTPLQREGI